MAQKKAASGQKTKKASTRKKVSKRKSAPRKKRVAEHDIREEAYFNYLNRGGKHGSHEEDWYKAEKKLKRKRGRKKKA